MRSIGCQLQRRPLRFGFVVGLLAALSAGGAWAETPEQGAAGQTTPQVELEQLLRLPTSLDYRLERRGAATRGEWRERFREAQTTLETAQTALERAQRELEGVAEDTEPWQLAPPGTGEAADAPLSYRLRQEIRRQRTEVKRAERRLQDLEVQADLAGVPEEWRN